MNKVLDNLEILPNNCKNFKVFELVWLSGSSSDHHLMARLRPLSWGLTWELNLVYRFLVMFNKFISCWKIYSLKELYLRLKFSEDDFLKLKIQLTMKL